MEFIIIAGEIDGEGQVAKGAAKTLVFKTKKPVPPHMVSMSL